MSIILIVVLILLCVGGLPQFTGDWHNYGYGPSSLVTLLIVIVVILALTGRL